MRSDSLHPALLCVEDHPRFGDAIARFDDQPEFVEDWFIWTNKLGEFRIRIEGDDVSLLQVGRKLCIRDVLLLHTWIVAELLLVAV